MSTVSFPPLEAAIAKFVHLLRKKGGGTSLVVHWLRLCLPMQGARLNPSQGARIPHALRPKSKSMKQKQYCNKFNEDFKNGPHPKKKKIFVFKNGMKNMFSM